MSSNSTNLKTIHYTNGDESPALATRSFYPIINRFFRDTNIHLSLTDISLAGRILSQFPDYLTNYQSINDDLKLLGELVHKPQTTIIKLPNISASIPQLQAAISELQSQGYAIPDFPQNPSNDTEIEIKNRYSKVLGSAVNPVLREGNSDRRAPLSVKNYAKHHPPQLGQWQTDTKTHVDSMDSGDFFENEKSMTLTNDVILRIEFENDHQEVTILKADIPGLTGEIIDATFMSYQSLYTFLKKAIDDAKRQNLLFSIHMKATMMKISDPIIFGAAVNAFFEPVFTKHHDILKDIGLDTKNGFQDLLTKITQLSAEQQREIEADIEECLSDRPPLAMVDSNNGITGLHAPNHLIVDASMPAMIRDSGKMWNPDGQQHETKAVIPDRTYARVYQTVIDDCKQHGAYDPRTMGSVSNVGLMAQKAEEYGSHDKTFQVPTNGIVRVVDQDNTVILEHTVHANDIWRMCQVKDIPIQNWVQLAVNRAKDTQTPAVFWLDQHRAHDRELIKKVTHYLQDHDTSDLDIHILAPDQATQFSLDQIRQGLDTISVTGNVLRDYLTDLFPILELGTSAKMLSIVPLLSGGGLFETGAGGSAPKHVEQLLKEGHLRWNSLGEFLALSACLAHLAKSSTHNIEHVLSTTLDHATGMLLDHERSPAHSVGELDTSGSHFYLALYWAEALSQQEDNPDLKTRFTSLFQQLKDNESTIVAEFKNAQGTPKDIGGYYHPDDQMATAVMRPSTTFNRCLD